MSTLSLLDEQIRATKAEVTTAAAIPGQRNLLHNGDFRVSQRGTTLAATGTSQNFLDRWQIQMAGGGTLACAQDTASVPPGHIYAMKFTVGTADATAPVSSGATHQYFVRQYVEAINTLGLAWGTSGAKTVTLSFWVKAPVVGVYGGYVSNGPDTRVFAFNYACATTGWEYKTITIPGDASATMPTGTGQSLAVGFALGGGNTYAANSWVTGAIGSPTNTPTTVMATAGNTWSLAGVQLEVGSATDFERVPYDHMLLTCQRYFQRVNGVNGVAIAGSPIALGMGISTTQASFWIPTRNQMRTTPGIGSTTAASGGFAMLNANNSSARTNGIGIQTFSATAGTVNGLSPFAVGLFFGSASTIYTIGQATWLFAYDSTGFIDLVADL